MMAMQGGTEAQVTAVNAKALSVALSRIRLVRHRLLEGTAELMVKEDLSLLEWASRQLYLASEELAPGGQDEDPPF